MTIKLGECHRSYNSIIIKRLVASMEVIKARLLSWILLFSCSLFLPSLSFSLGGENPSTEYDPDRVYSPHLSGSGRHRCSVLKGQVCRLLRGGIWLQEAHVRARSVSTTLRRDERATTEATMSKQVPAAPPGVPAVHANLPREWYYCLSITGAVPKSLPTRAGGRILECSVL